MGLCFCKTLVMPAFQRTRMHDSTGRAVFLTVAVRTLVCALQFHRCLLVTDCRRETICRTMANIHTFVVRTAVKAGMYTLPTRDTFLNNIGESGRCPLRWQAWRHLTVAAASCADWHTERRPPPQGQMRGSMQTPLWECQRPSSSRWALSESVNEQLPAHAWLLALLLSQSTCDR